MSTDFYLGRLKPSTQTSSLLWIPSANTTHRVSFAITSTIFTMLSSMHGLVCPLEAVVSTIVRPSGANSNSMTGYNTRIRSGQFPCSKLLQKDVHSTLRSRGHHTNWHAWRHLKLLIPSEMSSLVDYYEYTWVGSSNRNPTFSHYRWNQHDATALLLSRSSNIAEGWHHGFRSMLFCQNPSIWKFLECLKKEQSLTEVKMTKMMMREEAEPRLSKWRRYDERLQDDSYNLQRLLNSHRLPPLY